MFRTSRPSTLLPRQAVAPSASSWAHSPGVGWLARTTSRVCGWAALRRRISPGERSEPKFRMATRGRVLGDGRVELAERHVAGDHPQARVLADQASQPGFDEILEACEQHRHRAALVHTWRVSAPRRPRVRASNPKITRDGGRAPRRRCGTMLCKTSRGIADVTGMDFQDGRGVQRTRGPGRGPFFVPGLGSARSVQSAGPVRSAARQPVAARRSSTRVGVGPRRFERAPSQASGPGPPKLQP